MAIGVIVKVVFNHARMHMKDQASQRRTKHMHKQQNPADENPDRILKPTTCSLM
jgi:hypothetical protein